MAKCPRCQERRPKRSCPALGVDICAPCCGEERLRTISCVESCEYLAGEQYQTGRRQEKSRSGGRKFLEEMNELFSSRENLYTFAIMLHADIFAFSQVYGPLNNRRILMALERVKGLLSASAPTPHRLDDIDAEILKTLLRAHVDRTGSATGRGLLEEWDEAQRRFWVLRPDPPDIAEARVTDAPAVDLPQTAPVPASHTPGA